MRRFLGVIDTISEWSGKIISMLMLVVIGILLWEMLLRYAFNRPTMWAHELSAHLFGSYSVLAGAYVLLHHQHVSVDIIYNRFSPRGRAVLDSVTSIFFFLFVGILLATGIEMAWPALKIMEHSASPWGPPVYPLKLTIPIAAFLLLLQGLVHLIRALSMAITVRN